MTSFRKRLKKNRKKQAERWTKLLKAEAFHKEDKAAKHEAALISLELEERRLKDSK